MKQLTRDGAFLLAFWTTYAVGLALVIRWVLS